ncbi:MAG: heavy-metal-associated domain-containing protein, partial [Thermoleophilia bacterium]|nr:heavy-metal-associated domain-containing protein [Thermoleophilia bacterium]
MAVATSERERLQLEIEGMTCASCASRIERKLNKLDGVSATVNYATEAATVAFDPSVVAVDDLLRTVEAAGYHAALPDELATAPDGVA